MINNNKKIQI